MGRIYRYICFYYFGYILVSQAGPKRPELQGEEDEIQKHEG